MKTRSSDGLAVACFLLPNFLGFLLFTLGPIVVSLGLSFTNWDLLTPPTWAGFNNFSSLLGFHHQSGHWQANDGNFWYYLGNTFFLLLGLPVTMAASLALAILLNHKLRFMNIFRLIFFLPSILAGIAIFYLWKWIYNPDFGLINVFLASLGISGPKWLTNVHWAKPALIIMGVWLGAGGQGMLLYLAALQGISRDMYEAAAIDGAGAWQRFWAVTWPGLAPVTFFIFIMGIIHGLQGGFEAAYIMTGGGPNGATTTIGFYIFSKAYEQFQMGYAASIAWILFLIVFGFTLLNWRLGKKSFVS